MLSASPAAVTVAKPVCFPSIHPSGGGGGHWRPRGTAPHASEAAGFPISHPLWNTQLDLEQEMVDAGYNAYVLAAERASAKSSVSVLAHGARLVRAGLVDCL